MGRTWLRFARCPRGAFNGWGVATTSRRRVDGVAQYPHPGGAPGCLRSSSSSTRTLESLDRATLVDQRNHTRAHAALERCRKVVTRHRRLATRVVRRHPEKSFGIDENGLLTLIRDSLPPDERAPEPEVGDLKQDMELEGGLASAGGVKKPRAAAAAARPSPSSAATPAAAAAAAAPKPPPPMFEALAVDGEAQAQDSLLPDRRNSALLTPCRADSPRPRGPCLTSRRVAVIADDGWLKKLNSDVNGARLILTSAPRCWLARPATARHRWRTSC